MKWGVRRYQNKDGTRTKAGRERYSTGKQHRFGGSYSLRDLLNPRKRYEKEARQMLEEYSPERINEILEPFRSREKTKKARKLVAEKVSEWDNEIRETDRRHCTSMSQVKSIRTSHSADDDMRDANPDKSGTPSEIKSAIAYEMRRRGYDVCADKQVPEPSPYSDEGDVYKLFRDSSGNTPKPTKISTTLDLTTESVIAKVDKELSRYENGSRGIMTVDVDYEAFQTVNWNKKNGKIVLRDASRNEIVDPNYYFEPQTTITLMRTDDLKLSDDVLKYVHNRE